MAYSVEWKERMCIVKFSGTANDKEIKQCDKYCDGHKNFEGLRCAIWDFSEVIKFNLSELACIHIAAKDIGVAKKNPNLKVAFVVSQDRQDELVQMYEVRTMNLSWDVKAFNRFDEALKWCS